MLPAAFAAIRTSVARWPARPVTACRAVTSTTEAGYKLGVGRGMWEMMIGVRMQQPETRRLAAVLEA